VEIALAEADEGCAAAGSNQLCYGHNDLEADPQEAAQALNLRQPGDTEALTRVRALRLSPMDTDRDVWGVAIMQVRALSAVLDAAAPEDVTFLLFGDVALENQVKLVELEVVREVNVRAAPSADAKLVIGLFPAPDAPLTVTAIGRTMPGDWLRVQVPGKEDEIGWIRADLLDADARILALPVFDASGDASLVAPLGSMQAFYLESGRDDAPCSAAPDSGLLIQTEEGAAEVTLLMNEANIQLRATAYVQAQAGESMQLYVLEGEATVEAAGESHTLVPGTTLSVPLNVDGSAAGPPTAPQPFDPADLTGLPVGLLRREVEIPPAAAVRPDVPLAGTWNFIWNVPEADCGGERIQFDNESPGTRITVEGDGESFLMLLTRFIRESPGSYRAAFADVEGNQHKYVVMVTSFDRMQGAAEIFDPVAGCTLNVPFTLALDTADPVDLAGAGD
jgi:hypothetical protein